MHLDIFLGLCNVGMLMDICLLACFGSLPLLIVCRYCLFLLLCVSLNVDLPFRSPHQVNTQSLSKPSATETHPPRTTKMIQYVLSLIITYLQIL